MVRKGSNIVTSHNAHQCVTSVQYFCAILFTLLCDTGLLFADNAAMTEVGQKTDLEDFYKDNGNHGRECHVEESEGDREGKAEVFRRQDVLQVGQFDIVFMLSREEESGDNS